MKNVFSRNIVFSISLVITSVFVILGVFFNTSLGKVTTTFLSAVTEYFGWFYLTVTLGFLFFAVILLFSKFGKIRLGTDTDKPAYSTLSWIAMLFSAGMGIGLVFWGVAEPLFHYVDPLSGKGKTAEAANYAIAYTFFHWGLHPWGIYTIIGLSLAFFQYNKNLPGLISSTFYPILGKGIYGPVGKTIDILAIVATVFGIATSLGLGTMQISGGLSYLFGLPNTINMQILIIIVVTFLFVGSALIGIDRGMKVLSNINILLALCIMLLLILVGPTAQIFKVFTSTVGLYLDNLIPMSLKIKAFGDNSWISNWTLFYWAWWIAWAPFVGSFIAKVSKGRTIREFVLGVLFIPTLGTFLWFSTFGGSSLHLVQNLGKTALVNAAKADVTEALFVFFDYFSIGPVLSIIALILVVTFFVTSADSSTLVLSIFSSKGNLNPSKKIKFSWGIILALVAMVLLLSGSLDTLRAASIAAAFPFAIIMTIMCYTLLKGLRKEYSKLPKSPMNDVEEKTDQKVV